VFFIKRLLICPTWQLQLPACTDGVKCVPFIVILTFADKTTEDVFNGLHSKSARRVPQTVWAVAARKLDMLNAAADLRDLRIPPANRLKALKGEWSGYHSVRVNEQFRIVFQWIDGNAKNVEITDYH
jgi:proteic killer suppression protein